jgi:hypothetical protein
MIELLSCWSVKTSKEFTWTIGKAIFNLVCTNDLTLLVVISEICSNKNALKPAPNVGFKGISPGLVKK